jgi:glycosyltransferase involved in cell wall biosynthesis
MLGVSVAQLGARMHYAVPRVLAARGLLHRLFTDIWATDRISHSLNAVPEVLRPQVLKKMLGRRPEGVPLEKITSFASLGLLYALGRSAARTPSQMAALYIWAGTAFGRRVARSDMLAGSTAVYALNSAALELFRADSTRGMFKVLEQAIAPYELELGLVEEERRRFPEWAEPVISEKSAKAGCDRERGEWAAADSIVCGSEFVRAGLVQLGVPPAKCVVVPYGVEAVGLARSDPSPSARLKVLTVGTLGLRKGTHYVVEAARRLKDIADFRLVGPFSRPGLQSLMTAPNVRVIGPVPRSEIGEQFAWADVFLLPSLCEGSATSTYEALAAGIPVICTPNTGSVVRDALDGFIVPPRDVDALVAGLLALHGDRDRLRSMGDSARERAADFGLEQFGDRVVQVLERRLPC